MDDLDGPVHTSYGLLPNMLYVLGNHGVILYKSMWTTADRVAEFIDRHESHHPSPISVPMYTEQAEFRHADRTTFEERLKQNGPRSEAEWDQAKTIWTERARRSRQR